MSELLSFVIPCYRSEHTIQMVIDEIVSVAEQKKDRYDYEIIAVNDCSPDLVLDVLKSIAAENKKVKVVSLAMNRGKHAALMAGFHYASGDLIINVDDDMQCPVNRLWDLLEPLYHGYDVSIAEYPSPKESLFKRMGSAFNNWMIIKLLDKPAGMRFSNFVARKRFVCQEMIRYRHAFPYLEGLTLRTTRNICLVPMQERARVSGSSGYTFRNSLRLLVNGCTAFSVKPLRVSGILGLIFSAVGFLYGIFTVFRKIIHPSIAAGYSSLLAVNLLMGGLILLLLGVIGEYIGRIYICLNDSPQYVVRELINVDGQREGDRES